MESVNHKTSTRSTGAIFVRSELDDYGLTLAQFRLYGHISRRAGPKGCFESVPNLAKCCRMKPETARKALTFLAQQKLILLTPRSGESHFCKLTPILSWLPHPSRKGVGVAPPERGERGTPERGETHPSRKGVDKGSPSEGSPIKGGAEPPGIATHVPEKKRLEGWQLTKDRERILKQLNEERGKRPPDRGLIAGLKKELAEIEVALGGNGAPKEHSPPGRNTGTYNDGHAGDYANAAVSGKAVTTATEPPATAAPSTIVLKWPPGDLMKATLAEQERLAKEAQEAK